MKKLKSKTVFIVGASGGIGKVIARLAHEEGANVVLAARTQEKLDLLEKELGGKGVLVAPMDASNLKDVRKAFMSSVKVFGRVDVVVITAGTWKRLSVDSPLDDASMLVREHFQNLFLPSFFAAFVAQDFMRKQDSGGLIVNISSHAAVRPELRGNLTYGPFKAAARHFMLALFHELSGTNVRVCDIQPAIVNTQDVAGLLDTPEKKARAVQPEKIAQWIIDHINDPAIPQEKKFETKGDFVL